jgi:hypothetical protein
MLKYVFKLLVSWHNIYLVHKSFVLPYIDV